jgi:hypothetical protein
MTTELTTTETRLVERYAWVLDLVSRCAQGLDAGDWYYLADKADDLAARAERLAEVAGEIAQAVRDGRCGRPRAQLARRRRPPRPTSGHQGGSLMAAEPLRVCWIDRGYDRAAASDRVSRYGAYLANNAGLFDPWGEAPDGITRDPVEFAIAAFTVATGPIMSPGLVRWHSRVQGHQAARSEHDGRLVVSVTLAVGSPVRLAWDWQGWERDLHGHWREPDDRRPAGLARLELRWPVPTDQLPTPGRPRRPDLPNLRDATRAVGVLVEQVDATVGPVLADLEAREVPHD